MTLYELLTLRPAFDGQRPPGAAAADRLRGADAAAAAQPGDPARPGDDRPQGDGQGAGGALRHGAGAGRRPAAVPGGQADPGPAADPAGAGGEVGAAAPVAVAAAFLALLLTAGGLAAALVLIGRERDVVREQRRFAVEKSREADSERQRAEAGAQQARKAVDTMYTQVAEKWLKQQPQLEPLQRDFLLKSLGPILRKGSAREPGSRPSRSGERQQPLIAEWVISTPGWGSTPLPRRRTSPGDGDHGEPGGRVSPRRPNNISQRPGPDLGKPGQFAARHGTDGRSDSGPSPSRGNPARKPGCQPTGSARVSEGSRSSSLGPRESTENDRPTEKTPNAFTRQAVEINDKLATEIPSVPDYRQSAAGGQNNLAILLLETGRMGEAETAFRKALELRQSLVAESPNVPGYRQDLGTSHNTLGRILEDTGRLKEAGVSPTATVSKYSLRRPPIFPTCPAIGSAWLAFSSASGSTCSIPDGSRKPRRLTEIR